MKVMKSLTFPLLLSAVLISCYQNQGKLSDILNKPVTQLVDTSDITNNFYDNTQTISLPVAELIVEGEISNPGKVNFSALPLRSVIVKETLLDNAGDDKFTGAYRYDGYSLFDILDSRKINKKNTEEFNPVIDLYIEVETSRGEKAVFSWGEIYYPNNLHKIIIASGVSRIVPSKTKDLWPLPAESKIVAGNDLITERNISAPVRISLRSFPKSFKVKRGMQEMYSPDIKLFNRDRQLAVISDINDKPGTTFNTVFYGRGKGIHSTSPFTGYMLKDIIGKYYPVNRISLQTGMLCITGKDGYRCAVSYSELFNRNDQQEFLLVRSKTDDAGGLFRIFPACDFFSDRAIKSVSEIHLDH